MIERLMHAYQRVADEFRNALKGEKDSIIKIALATIGIAVLLVFTILYAKQLILAVAFIIFICSCLPSTPTKPSGFDFSVRVGELEPSYGIFPEMVERKFVKLISIFEVAFFVTVQEDFNNLRYQFDYRLKAEQAQDINLVQLATAIAAHILQQYIQQQEVYDIVARRLVAVEITDEGLFVIFAKSYAGIIVTDAINTRVRRQMTANTKRKPSARTAKKVDSPVLFGYNYEHAKEYGIKSPILHSMNSHCHALIYGSSGSGKSTALLYILCYLFAHNKMDNTVIADYKNSEDFAFLADSKGYYAGEKASLGIEKYYQSFLDAKKSGKKRRCLLVIEEYPAMILYLQMQDKLNKTKRATEVMSWVSEILMMGRGLGFGIWVVTQTPSATLFPDGGRANFMLILALGKLSKEQRNMMFSGLDFPDCTFNVGEGVLLADGSDLQTVKFPHIGSMDKLKTSIHDALARSGGSESP